MMTSLGQEIQTARRKLVRDGLDMSVGELASLYERDELLISPPYQRLFRWEAQQKTRFIESIFLNIPIPSIFVYTRPNGTWELVDGLQRVSTCLQFMGKLPGHARHVCEGTRLVPSLADVFWPAAGEGNKKHALPEDLCLNFRRAKLRVEVLASETDPTVRFELFQRLNAGGTKLSEQEVRSCVIYSINEAAYNVLQQVAANDDLQACYAPTDRQIDEQHVVELVVRTVCMRHIPYDGRMDVHEYLTHAISQIAADLSFDWNKERVVLERTYEFIRSVIGKDAFRREQRSLGLYEFAALGTSKLMERTEGETIDADRYRQRYDCLKNDPDLTRYTQGGVRGTERWRHFVTKRAYDYFTK